MNPVLTGYFPRKRASRPGPRLLPLVVAALAAASSGCITAHCVRKEAMSHETFDVGKREDKFVPGRPGYYALLPVTVATDLATAPFQLVYFMYSTRETSFQWVTIQ